MRHHPDQESYGEDASERTGPIEPVARPQEAAPPAGDVLSDGWVLVEEQGADGADGVDGGRGGSTEPMAPTKPTEPMAPTGPEAARRTGSPDPMPDDDDRRDGLAEPDAVGVAGAAGTDRSSTAGWTPGRDAAATADRDSDRDVAVAMWGPDGDGGPRRRGRLLLAAVTGVVAVGLAGGWFLSSVGDSMPEAGCSANGRCVKAELPGAPADAPTKAAKERARPAETTPSPAEERATAAPETSRPVAPRTRAPRPEPARATPTARHTPKPTREREEQRDIDHRPRVTSAPSAETPDSRQSTAPEQTSQPAQPSGPAETTVPAQNPPPERGRHGGLLDWLF
ncbi:hypothetical protein [Streptosporangium nondiastaticum]|uniref:hypothetical protein n=1 Tax=Streptosporangium nondiastaticum TaxID=35764 RepID=UPI0031F8CCD3